MKASGGVKGIDDARAMFEAGATRIGASVVVKIAQEALVAVKARVQGAYIMPPFDRVESALEILRAL